MHDAPLLVASLLAQKMEGTLPWFQPKDRHLVSSQRVTSLAFPRVDRLALSRAGIGDSCMSWHDGRQLSDATASR